MQVQVITSSTGRDMRSLCALSAAQVLPAGFAEYWTDLTGAADHSFSLGGSATAASVTTESGGKRRLDTHAAAGVSEIMPYYDQASTNQQLPTMVNPKSAAWYVEGRAAIETHGANSLLFPCSIALTSGGTMKVTLNSNTFCALGLAGTGYAGGSNANLSFAASSAGVMVLQTTTIPWVATMQSYSLHFDGSGTITARAYTASAVQEWTTTTLTQIFAGSDGFHPNQWTFVTDATVTTMLVDYLYGAGPRI